MRKYYVCVYVYNSTNIYLSSASVIQQNTAFIILHYVQLILLVAKYIKTTPLRNVVDDSCFEVSSKLSLSKIETQLFSLFFKQNHLEEALNQSIVLFTSAKLFFLRIWFVCDEGVLRYRNSWPWTTAEKMYTFLKRQTKLNHQRVIADIFAKDVILEVLYCICCTTNSLTWSKLIWNVWKIGRWKQASHMCW